MEFVDAHQHFWKIARGDYSWMDESTEGIRRDYYPRDLEALAEPLGIRSSVAIQAAPTVAETEFLLSLAEGNPLVQGVVGWVDLTDGNCARVLERLARNPKLKGIRPFLEYIPEEEWMLDPQVIANLREAARLGLSFDALIRPRHFDVMRRFADKLSDLPIVIDHCAKPVIANGRDPGDDWRKAMEELAQRDNVWCKFSGLPSECGRGWSTEDLRPVFEHVVACFGPRRVMWGSDWPVLELVGSYAQWFHAARDLAAALGESDQLAIFSTTARRFYRL